MALADIIHHARIKTTNVPVARNDECDESDWVREIKTGKWEGKRLNEREWKTRDETQKRKSVEQREAEGRGRRSLTKQDKPVMKQQ